MKKSLSYLKRESAIMQVNSIEKSLANIESREIILLYNWISLMKKYKAESGNNYHIATTSLSQ